VKSRNKHILVYRYEKKRRSQMKRAIRLYETEENTNKNMRESE
jgi:hypothetical protein